LVSLIHDKKLKQFCNVNWKMGRVDWAHMRGRSICPTLFGEPANMCIAVRLPKFRLCHQNWQNRHRIAKMWKWKGPQWCENEKKRFQPSVIKSLASIIFPTSSSTPVRLVPRTGPIWQMTMPESQNLVCCYQWKMRPKKKKARVGHSVSAQKKIIFWGDASLFSALSMHPSCWMRRLGESVLEQFVIMQQ
jgi:hypothetical protein